MVSSVDGLAGAAAVGSSEVPPPRREVASEAVTGRHVRFAPESDMCGATRHVRFVPIADVSGATLFASESGNSALLKP